MISSKTFRRIVAEIGPVTLIGVGCLTLAGCGGNSAPAPVDTVVPAPETSQPTTATAAESGTAEKPALASSGNTRHKRDEVWVDERGQKWFGNVPMDAFFDNAYEVASNQESIGGTGVAVANAGGATEPEMTPDAAAGSEAPATTPSDPSKPSAETAAPPAAGGEDSWAALITAATIDEEVKSIRNFLNENVHSVGTFNSSMLMIPPKAAALGAIAGIVMEHPESVPWKDDAKYVRDLAKKMNSSALQRGAKDQKRIEELYDAVDATLSRSKPAGLEEPPESDSFAEVAEMRLLMMRMEEAEKRLKTEAGTEGAMGEKKAMVAHEASMMAVMAKIVALPAYGYGDDAKFTGYAKEVLKASQDIKTAAESGDFAGYESALTRVSTTCSNCHSDFKND